MPAPFSLEAIARPLEESERTFKVDQREGSSSKCFTARIVYSNPFNDRLSQIQSRGQGFLNGRRLFRQLRQLFFQLLRLSPNLGIWLDTALLRFRRTSSRRCSMSRKTVSLFPLPGVSAIHFDHCFMVEAANISNLLPTERCLSVKRKRSDSSTAIVGHASQVLTQDGSASPTPKRQKGSAPAIKKGQRETSMCMSTSRVGRLRDSATAFVKATWTAATGWGEAMN